LANHKSAEKRALQNEKRRVRNKAVKTSIKRVTKEVRLESAGSSKDAALTKLNSAKSIIDKAVKKGVIPKKTAARKISSLTKMVNTIVII